ncbi:MAG: sugar transferase [Elusimicrobia bacterium]|nr:sugar transferase [Elusimicrobiota bacterium]
MYRSFGKRLFDVAFSAAALALLSPILIVVAALIRLKLGSPILFTQERPGFNGKPFRIWKFRTMTDARDAHGNSLPDAERLTTFGRWLRRASLDELPEFVNVLRGEMSVVGPRPLLMEYIPRYNQRQARRHEALPGITGWAQVNGRNAVSWPERFELDVWYVEHVGFWLDIGIIVDTVAIVFSGKGTTAKGHATMPYFMGNEEKRS